MNDGQLLTILIPTYNHPSYIADILNKYKDLLKFNVFLDIYDASENDETYRIIQKYSFSTLRYFSLPGVSLDERTLIALSSARTPYLFLCGDGYMLTERGYLRVKEYIEKGFDVIEMYDLAIPKDVTYYRSLQAKYNKDPIIYREVKQHFCDNFWHMPFYGGSIVKADAYKDGYSNYRESIGSLFSNVYSLYKFYSNKKCNLVTLCDYFLYFCPLKKQAVWSEAGQDLYIWGESMSKIIDMLPPIYDDKKKKVKKSIGKRTGFISFSSIARLKKRGFFQHSDYKLLKSYICSCSNVSRLQLKFLDIFPRKFLLLLGKKRPK